MKLTKKQKELLKLVGITEGTEEEICNAIVEKLAEQDIDADVEDGAEELFEMLSVFAEELSDDLDPDEPEDEDEEPEDEDEEPEDEDEEPEDDDEEDELEEEEEPVKKKPVKKVVAKKPPVKKATKKVVAKKSASKNRRFNNKTNPEDLDVVNKLYCDVIDNTFPDLQFEHKVLTNGITTKLVDVKNVSRALFTFNFISISPDNKVLSGELALNGLRLERDVSEEAVMKYLPEDYEDKLSIIQNNLPILRGIKQNEALEILTEDLVNHMASKYQKLGARMNKNRQKLEEKVKEENEAKKAALKKKASTATKKTTTTSTTKAAAKKPVKKAATTARKKTTAKK